MSTAYQETIDQVLSRQYQAAEAAYDHFYKLVMKVRDLHLENRFQLVQEVRKQMDEKKAILVSGTKPAIVEQPLSGTRSTTNTNISGLYPGGQRFQPNNFQIWDPRHYTYSRPFADPKFLAPKNLRDFNIFK